VAGGGADTSKFIGGNADSGTAAAQKDGSIGAFFGNGISRFFGVIGIIDGVCRVGA